MSEHVYVVPADAAAVVQRRVAEAAAWCGGQVAQGNRLRTPALQPERPFVLERRLPDGTCHHEYLDTINRAAEVERVALRRAELLALNGIIPTDLPQDRSLGRLLRFDIDNSGWEGLSEGESDYFDVYDIPAWDGWIHLQRTESIDVLLSWVPLPLVERVGSGIAVNCMACIGWVDRLV